MRLALAREFGGGPAYWGLPDPADEDTLATALGLLAYEKHRADKRTT